MDAVHENEKKGIRNAYCDKEKKKKAQETRKEEKRKENSKWILRNWIVLHSKFPFPFCFLFIKTEIRAK